MKQRMILSTAAAAALALGAFGMSDAVAQQEGQQAPEQPGAEEIPDFSDEELAAFVDAAEDVQGVQESYLPEIEGAADDQEAAELQQQMNDEMVQVVEQADGIDVDTYNQVAQAAQMDPELNDRILEMMGMEAPQ